YTLKRHLDTERAVLVDYAELQRKHAPEKQLPPIAWQHVRQGDGTDDGADEVGVHLPDRGRGPEDRVCLGEALRVLRDVARLAPVDREGGDGGAGEGVIGCFPRVGRLAERREKEESQDQKRGSAAAWPSGRCDMGVVHGERLDRIGMIRGVRICFGFVMTRSRRGGTETL